MADNSIALNYERFFFRQHMMALYKYFSINRLVKMRMVLNKRHIPFLIDLYCGATYRTKQQCDDMRDSILRGEGKWMGIPFTIED